MPSPCKNDFSSFRILEEPHENHQLVKGVSQPSLNYSSYQRWEERMRSAMTEQNVLQPEQPVKRKPGRPRLSEEEKKRRRLEKKKAKAPPTKAT